LTVTPAFFVLADDEASPSDFFKLNFIVMVSLMHNCIRYCLW
jgi:hypothetical protein